MAPWLLCNAPGLESSDFGLSSHSGLHPPPLPTCFFQLKSAFVCAMLAAAVTGDIANQRRVVWARLTLSRAGTPACMCERLQNVL